MKIANRGLIISLLVIPAFLSLITNNLMLAIEILVLQILLGIEVDED